MISFTWLLARVALGFADDNCKLTRSLSQSFAVTNSPVLVTATFTNGGSNVLRGFWYADQVPTGLAVATVSVAHNGLNLTNVLSESGLDGDVTPGCTPWRWVLETPPLFPEANPLMPGDSLQITYALTAAVPGAVSLPAFDWAGCYGSSNGVFGCSQAADQQVVNFLVTTNPPTLQIQSATNGVTLNLQGVPGASYVLDFSSNMVGWTPLATNTGSFTFIDTAAPGLPGRFYRGRLVTTSP